MHETCGLTTLSDDSIQKRKGSFLGKFGAEDRLLVIYKDGNYEITDQELTQRFDADKILLIEKFNPEKIVTAVYLDSEKAQYSIKRFKIETNSLHNKFLFIKEGEGNRLEAVSTDEEPILIMQSGRGAQVRKAKIKTAKAVEVMGWKAVGAKLTEYTKSLTMEWEQKKKPGQPELFD